MILEGEGHGEIGFTMHAAQTIRKHIQAWAKRERTGFINLMNNSKMVSYNFTSQVLKTQRTFVLLNGNWNLSDCGTKAMNYGACTSGMSLLGNWRFLYCRGVGCLLIGLQAIQTQETGMTGGALVECCLRSIFNDMAGDIYRSNILSTRASTFRCRLSVRLGLVVRA